MLGLPAKFFHSITFWFAYQSTIVIHHSSEAIR